MKLQKHTMAAKTSAAFQESFFLPVHIIVCGKQVHGLQQLMAVDKRPHNDKRTQNAPTPECARTKLIVDASAPQFRTDPVGKPMTPNKGNNA